MSTIESFASHAEAASNYLVELEKDETFTAYKTAKKEMSGAIKTLLKAEGIAASALLAAVQTLDLPRVEKKVREIAGKQGADLSEKAEPMELSDEFIATAKNYAEKHEAATKLETYDSFRTEKKAYKAAMKSLIDSGTSVEQLKAGLDGKEIHSKISKKVDYWTTHNEKMS